jgi:hypothetical protein
LVSLVSREMVAVRFWGIVAVGDELVKEASLKWSYWRVNGV